MEMFGERLRRLREARGLKQRELGQRAEMDPAQISRYERGVIREPSGDVLARLARALNVSVPELRGDAEVDADLARLGSAWSRASDADRRKIMDVIRRVEREQKTRPDSSAN